jgi:hypothetical protein
MENIKTEADDARRLRIEIPVTSQLYRRSDNAPILGLGEAA